MQPSQEEFGKNKYSTSVPFQLLKPKEINFLLAAELRNSYYELEKEDDSTSTLLPVKITFSL